MSALTKMAKRFYPYAQEYLGFDKPAQIVYESDPENAQNPLGKTAHYQPDNYTVTLYVDGRHPKDLLRSLAHELVHHTQNCRGDLSPEKMGETGDGYAQTDGHLRKMEQEAYASMVMRDWEDQHKSKRRNNLKETIYNNKEYITMSEHEKLVQRIVAEVFKNAEVTTESEEDEDVQEEGQGDRNDSDREQGRASSDRRQGVSSSGGAGQNLEEASDDDDDAEVTTEGSDNDDTDAEVTTESREGVLSTAELMALADAGWGPDQLRGLNKTNLPPEAIEILQAAGLLREGEYKRDDDESKDEGNKPPWLKKDDDKEVKEEAKDSDDESTDDLQETFQRRNNLLFEKLCKWSKQ